MNALKKLMVLSGAIVNAMAHSALRRAKVAANAIPAAKGFTRSTALPQLCGRAKL
jgi:hypothetical protein